MWWTEFKRSPSKWFALPVALVIGAIAYARYDQWYGVWPQLSMVVQFGAAVAVPLLSAAAATASLQRARAGMDEQFGAAARNPWLRELTVLTATLVWAVLPPLGVLIVVSVISAAVAGPGGPWPRVRRRRGCRQHRAGSLLDAVRLVHRLSDGGGDVGPDGGQYGRPSGDRRGVGAAAGRAVRLGPGTSRCAAGSLRWIARASSSGCGRGSCRWC